MSPSRSVMKAWKSWSVNSASWLPGVGLTRRTMSRTGRASFPPLNGVYVVSATSAPPSIQILL